MAGLSDQATSGDQVVKILREKSILRTSRSVQEIAAQTDPLEIEPSPASATVAKVYNHHLKYLNIEKTKLGNNGMWTLEQAR